jgi:endonuclease YncB( thermonuclease family)
MVISTVCFADDIKLPILRIIDGDTIGTTIACLPNSLNKLSVRIYGIDTPEKGNRAGCAKESLLGVMATEKLKTLIGNNREMLVKNVKWDKYGSRIDGIVFVNDVNLGDEMIKAVLAKPYFGQTKQSWCN